MTRFQLYLLLLGFAMCVLLIQTGIPYPWRWKSNQNLLNYRLLNYKKQFQLKTSEMLTHFDSTEGKSIIETNNKMTENASLGKLNNEEKSTKKLPFLQNIQPFPPWSYDRFIANMTHLLKHKRNQKQLHSLLSSAFSPLNSLPVIPESSVIRILLITYFRSGSTFLGDLLQQNWKSFHTFEPLHYMSDGVRIDDHRVEEANHLIEDIFRCDFQSNPNYVEWVHKTKNQFLFKWNKFLWSVCRFRAKTCFEPKFIGETCLRAKVHIMKVVRLQMRHLDSLLPKLNDLNVRVMFLVRDPRGTLNSRRNMLWCNHNCSDINSLCSEMRQDLHSFKQLKHTFPSIKFTLVRYEDLSTDPIRYVKSLMKEMGISYSASVRRFVQTHTNSSFSELSKRNPYTTVRNSKSVAYEWMQTLNTSDILEVQNICSDLLNELNYKFINTNDNKPHNESDFDANKV